ncbi:unnamed protein product [Amoebophrya sp. A25]|nr:unnamed protein product [Amoebophrya sp. A25]|eukprot:GSA25T00010280001.1
MLEQSEIPLSVFFKTTQMFDRFLEHSVKEQFANATAAAAHGGSAGAQTQQEILSSKGGLKQICPSPLSASMSTLASSPKTPENMTGALVPGAAGGYVWKNILEQLHSDMERQLCSRMLIADASAQNPLYQEEGWTVRATHRAVGLACCSLVMKLDFRKHYSKHYDALITNASHHLVNPLEQQTDGSFSAAAAGVQLTPSCQSGDQNITYFFSMANVKAFIQSIEWPIIKNLRYRLSVPSIIDFLDYFDTQCQIRSKKSYAVDVIMYHPELLYGNKMTAISLAVWFLSHKNQEHVHAILQKMQTFDSFASSKRLEEKRRLIAASRHEDQSPSTRQISEHAISTADLRVLVTQLRDGFRSGAAAAAGNATSGAGSSSASATTTSASGVATTGTSSCTAINGGSVAAQQGNCGANPNHAGDASSVASNASAMNTGHFQHELGGIATACGMSMSGGPAAASTTNSRAPACSTTSIGAPLVNSNNAGISTSAASGGTNGTTAMGRGPSSEGGPGGCGASNFHPVSGAGGAGPCSGPTTTALSSCSSSGGSGVPSSSGVSSRSALMSSNGGHHMTTGACPTSSTVPGGCCNPNSSSGGIPRTSTGGSSSSTAASSSINAAPGAQNVVGAANSGQVMVNQQHVGNQHSMNAASLHQQHVQQHPPSASNHMMLHQHQQNVNAPPQQQGQQQLQGPAGLMNGGTTTPSSLHQQQVHLQQQQQQACSTSTQQQQACAQLQVQQQGPPSHASTQHQHLMGTTTAPLGVGVQHQHQGSIFVNSGAGPPCGPALHQPGVLPQHQLHHHLQQSHHVLQQQIQAHQHQQGVQQVVGHQGGPHSVQGQHLVAPQQQPSQHQIQLMHHQQNVPQQHSDAGYNFHNGTLLPGGPHFRSGYHVQQIVEHQSARLQHPQMTFPS